MADMPSAHPAPTPPHTGSPTVDSLDDVRRARAYLLRVAEPPAVSLAGYVAARGPVTAARHVRAGRVPDAVLRETAARRDQDLVDDDFAAAARVGARLVVPEDTEWPTRPVAALAAAAGEGRSWATPPLALWVRGTAPLQDAFDQAAAVIGARAATGYGEHVAAEFGYTLAASGVTVAAGAGYGIDGAAHRGALAAEGMTAAVLACGIDIAYPAGHTDLIDRIAARGLLLSEYPPGTTPARHRFLTRNRLIAALTGATVVVEAGIRSGARSTVGIAAALKKPVLVVPGPITSAMSALCHDLLGRGEARIATAAGDVQHALDIVHSGPS